MRNIQLRGMILKKKKWMIFRNIAHFYCYIAVFTIFEVFKPVRNYEPAESKSDYNQEADECKYFSGVQPIDGVAD